MDEGKILLGLFAGCLAFLAHIFYILSILKGYTRPNRATWWIWTGVSLIIASSYFWSGARNTMPVPIGECLSLLIVAILSIFYGEGGWSRFDRFCIAGAVASLALWYMFESPELALVTSLGIDFFAALPTIKKSFLDPCGEDRPAWTMTTVANLLNLCATESRQFAVLLYPMYTLFIDGSIMALLYRKLNRCSVTPQA